MSSNLAGSAIFLHISRHLPRAHFVLTALGLVAEAPRKQSDACCGVAKRTTSELADDARDHVAAPRCARIQLSSRITRAELEIGELRSAHRAPAGRKRILVSALSISARWWRPAPRRSGTTCEVIPVDPHGQIDPLRLAKMMSEDVLCVQWPLTMKSARFRTWPP